MKPEHEKLAMDYADAVAEHKAAVEVFERSLEAEPFDDAAYGEASIVMADTWRARQVAFCAMIAGGRA